MFKKQNHATRARLNPRENREAEEGGVKARKDPNVRANFNCGQRQIQVTSIVLIVGLVVLAADD